MIYQNYSIGGELLHSAKGQEWTNHKYKEKKKSKTTGKWYYVYDKKKSTTSQKYDSSTYDNEIKKYKNMAEDARIKAFNKAKTDKERIYYLIEAIKYDKQVKIAEQKKNEAEARALGLLYDIDKKKV